jgi:hypothetical protein
MIRCEFWHTPTDAIAWTFNREPAIGEEVLLGDRGFFRVTGARAHGPDVDAAFDCEFVREPTHAEMREMLRRGVNRLP